MMFRNRTGPRSRNDMSSHSLAINSAKPLDLSKWRNVPNLMIGGGAVLAVSGLAIFGFKQFGYSYLVAYMFCLSLCLGSLFLVLAHHLFDAGWSVPIRRFCEHIASLLWGWMLVLVLPLLVLAPKLYPWMSSNPATDHALRAKWPLFTLPGFYIAIAGSLIVLGFLAKQLRAWSIKQDATGAAECTYKMRGYSYWGIFAFASLVTMLLIMLVKGLEHEWFSTMYGVWYFAGSVWTTLATVYVITMVLTRLNILRPVLHHHQFYYIGSLFFAFTVFYAYVTFAQYFIIWNANMPEETFWYVQREKGTWFVMSIIFIIFGHFFLPFLSLLRIDAKQSFKLMSFLAVWAWLMHFIDMTFNIMPVLHPDGFPFQTIWIDLGCLAFIAGILIKVFLIKFASAAPYPIKDPRLIEAVGQFHPVPTQISGGELDETSEHDQTDEFQKDDIH